MNSLYQALGKIILFCLCMLGLWETAINAQVMRATDYEVDEQIFANPERGFYKYTDLHALDPEIGYIRSDHDTLIWGRINLESYRDAPSLPQSFLDQVQQGFDIARAQGVKVIVRGSYGYEGPCGDYTCYEDPPKQYIKNHIAQLSPIFLANADVIALFEAGFIGPWGEWHTTPIAEDFTQGREILFYLLDYIPTDLMAVIRYPYTKQQIFKTTSGFEFVDASNAYSISNVARVGHHNDCFLSSENDFGTYEQGTMSRAEETQYISDETQYTPYGGESCALHPLNDCQRAVQELEVLHGTYLNNAYHPDVLDKWKTQGCYDDIKKRLGARFVIQQSRISAVASPGNTLQIEIDLQNVGFASLYRSRKVQIILKNEATSQEWTFDLNEDPRWWKPGPVIMVQHTLSLPTTIPEGSYTVYLNLADSSSSLDHDPRYSYRIANLGMWEASTGYNQLVSGIRIERSQPERVDLERAIKNLKEGGGASETDVKNLIHEYMETD